MEGYTLKQLKGFKFEFIKDMFDKAFKRVNTFVDYKIELVEGSEKRAEDSTKKAGTELEQEVAKKQKIDDAKVDNDQEEARMKELMNIVPDEEEVAIDVVPLSTKPPSIIDYKIIKEGKISIYQIIRADGSLKRRSSVEGRIVEIKRLHDDLRVTAAQLVLLVQSYNCLFKVNAAGTKLQLLKDYNCSRIKTAEKIKIDWRSRILT
ncbi:hypothetical protein Tco_0472124 [Tanacetum coccineum]